MRFSAPLLFFLPTLFTHTLAQTVTFEAENGSRSGTTVDTAASGYSGTGYVTGFFDAASSLTISVNAPSTGLYNFDITYQAPNGEKYTSVELNGGTFGDVHFPATTSWTTITAGQVLLTQGTSTIKFTTDWGYYFIDKIALSPAPTPPPHNVPGTLNNPNASQAAKTLMSYLTSIYGKHMLSGQQDPTSYVWVQNNVGKSPAMLGHDMIDYSPSRVAFGTNSHAVEDAISYDAAGTMIAFVWHWNAPTDLLNTAAEPWYFGFYTAATTFNLANALADKGGSDYALILRDIDAIATQLKRLQAANVPILWRPLHEAEGGWFWWGRDKNPAPAKELYRILYDRLTNYHGINNLIWVWNSVSSDWYPGDDVVDILSSDSYPATSGDHGAVSGTYNALVSLGQDKKLVSLAEVGEIPDPSQLQSYHADWLYFCTWTGDYITGSDHNSLSYLKTIYNSGYVLNRDDIAGWKRYSGGVIKLADSNLNTSSTTSNPSTSTTSSTTSDSSTSTASSTTSDSSASTTSSTTSNSNNSTTSTTTSTTRTTTSSGCEATQTIYGRCGGRGHRGHTKCATGLTCVAVSPPWYYQCLQQ